MADWTSFRWIGLALMAALGVDAAGSLASATARDGIAPASRENITDASQAGGAKARYLSPEPFGLRDAKPEGAVYEAQWSATLNVIAGDRRQLAACRADAARCTPATRELIGIVDAARAAAGLARIGTVNRAVNLAVAYASDAVQYGRPNVWTGPLTTFGTGHGDCKDYAIAKYLAFLELGVAPDDLRLVIVRQPHPGQPLHAVLTVRSGGEWLVLDNRHFRLVATTEVTGYDALASFGDVAPALRPTFAEVEPGSSNAGAQPSS